MRNKIVMITALLAMMVGMTGIVAANPFNLAIVGGSNPLELSPGDSVTLDLVGTNFHSGDIAVSQMYTLSAIVSCNPTTPVCTPADITVTFNSATFGPAISGTQTNSGIMTVKRSATPADDNTKKYVIDVQAGPNGANAEKGVATRGVNNIPEFATVAIPIAAVLGLVFFFQQRKNKKE